MALPNVSNGRDMGNEEDPTIQFNGYLGFKVISLELTVKRVKLHLTVAVRCKKINK